jgi:Putative Ig domain
VSAGLTLDPTTGVVSGTPTTVTGPVKFTVIAINSGGSTTASLTITVNDLAPTNLNYAASAAVYGRDPHRRQHPNQ